MFLGETGSFSRSADTSTLDDALTLSTEPITFGICENFIIGELAPF